MAFIDDLEEKLNRPTKKYAKSFPKNSLNALIQLCRQTIVCSYIQRMYTDADSKWIFPESVALDVKANPAFVAIALGRLEKAGLLFPPEPFPTDKKISIGNDARGLSNVYVFRNGAWYIKKLERKVSGFRRINRIYPVFKSKTVYVKSNWNGKARRINTDSELFYQTCIELDINPLIVQDWVCSCGKRHSSHDTHCYRCDKDRILPPIKDIKENLCKLCGMPHRTHGRKHTNHTKEACLNKVIEIVHKT